MDILDVLFGKSLKTKEDKAVVYKKIYDDYVLTFDAVDNGVSQYPAEVKPAYRNASDIFSMVARLNPSWNEPSKDHDGCFRQAMDLVGNDFISFSKQVVESWLPAKELLWSSAKASLGRVLIMETSFPWKEHLFNYESEMNMKGHFLYAVFPDETNKDWRVQAVPVDPDSFQCRLNLPSEWRGLRNTDLDSLLGYEGCVFVHASGFIGGHKTKEGALQMASSSISLMQ